MRIMRLFFPTITRTRGFWQFFLCLTLCLEVLYGESVAAQSLYSPYSPQSTYSPATSPTTTHGFAPVTSAQYIPAGGTSPVIGTAVPHSATVPYATAPVGGPYSQPYYQQSPQVSQTTPSYLQPQMAAMQFGGTSSAPYYSGYSGYTGYSGIGGGGSCLPDDPTCDDGNCGGWYSSQRGGAWYPVKNEFIRYGRGFKQLYTADNGLNYGLALIVGGTLANTPMDTSVRNWYQEDVRGKGTDDFAKVCKVFGEGQIWIPTAILLGFSYRWMEENNVGRDSRTLNTTGTFFSRTARGYVVGAPTLLIGQSLLGAGRPGANSYGSAWRPFENGNGISGHAFIGAVPFITAAQMTKDWRWKTVFYTCSTFPAWSRINDDAHYLSQVVLGWYLAYLTCRAINQSDGGRLPKGMTLFPIVEPSTVGIGFQYNR